MSAQLYKSLPVIVRNGLRSCGIEVSRYRGRGKEILPRAVNNEFKNLYKKYYSYSMVKWPALYMAFNAVDHIINNKIEGSIVECGVWKGGCSAIMAEHFANKKDVSRDLYLYDTFEGMVEPTEKDFSLSIDKTAEEISQDHRKDGEMDWCAGPLETVKEVLGKTNYPDDKIHTVKGRVEETIPKTVPDKIALLRLDTDWYESTKHELENLFPRLVSGGLLLVDDYGSWSGSKQAVDEYFDKNPCGIFFHYDSVSGSICGVKP